jgi:flagellar biosynthetic protein FliQ
MDEQIALDLGRQVLLLTLKISLPLLCVGLVVGVVISILQAVTQIQEMTLTFVPKTIAMVIAAAFFLPWIMVQLTDFAKAMFGPMPIP